MNKNCLQYYCLLLKPLVMFPFIYKMCACVYLRVCFIGTAEKRNSQLDPVKP